MHYFLFFFVLLVLPVPWLPHVVFLPLIGLHDAACCIYAVCEGMLIIEVFMSGDSA